MVGNVDTTQIDKIVWEWNMKSSVTNPTSQIFSQHIDIVRASGALMQGVTGKIGRAITFDGSDANNMALSKTVVTNAATNTTISAWFYPLSSTGGVIIGSQYYLNPYPRVGLSMGANNNMTEPRDQYVRFSKLTVLHFAPTKASITNWHYVVVSSMPTGSFLYVDGALTTNFQPTINENLADTALGAMYGKSGTTVLGPPANNFNSIIDEVRIAAETRSADWVATEYNNQSDPVSFAVPGEERPFPSGTIFKIY